MTGYPIVYAVSDSTGETAEQAVRAAVAQFGPSSEIRTLVFGRVRDEAGLRSVVERAKKERALVVYTLVDPKQRAGMRRLAGELGLVAVDLLSGLIHEIGRHLDRKPLAVPGLGHETDEAYFRRIEAVEFSVYNDDGKLPANLRKADIVLVGVSRTSKTPLSNYIAHRGYKVANVPLVKDLPPPKELDGVDPLRVFALVVDPATLTNIRRRRNEVLGVTEETPYTDPRSVRDELLWARRIMRDHPQWTEVDITDRAVEETAAHILQLWRERFEIPRQAAAKERA